MTEKIMAQNLIALAQTYATARGLALSTVSKEIHGNHTFLERFLAGDMSPTVATYFTMVNRLRRSWPKGTPWPTTVAVPKLGKKVDKGFDEG